MLKKPLFKDDQQEAMALDGQRKRLEDVVLISQAWHAVFTVLRKHKVPTDLLSSAYYDAYHKLMTLIPLDYANPEVAIRSKAKEAE